MKTRPIREEIISAPLVETMRRRVQKMRARGYDQALLPIVDAVEGTFETLATALLPSLLMRLEELERENADLEARVRRLEER